MFNTGQGSQFTSLEFTQVLQGRGVRISMDGKGRYQDNIFVGAAVADGKVRRGVPESQRQRPGGPAGAGDYFRFYNGLRPHQTLGYRTPAEVFHGDQGIVVEGDSDERRGSPQEGTKSMAGEPGFSLNSALILSN